LATGADFSDTGFMSARLHSQKIMAFVGVRDPDRAKAFYRDTLGLQLVTEQLPFALVFDAHGIMLRVSIVPKVTAAPYTVLGWEVPDIAAAVKELGSAGVEFERFTGMNQDKLGVWKSPGGARVAWFKDPDGNLLSLTQL
jgi:catechol 2,3-dioxygenase-like lactoylglutathione lyase family enzyme